jgi:dUTP pyrophosphatase
MPDPSEIWPGAQERHHRGQYARDYRGEVKVILVNLGADPFEVTRGMRIGQMVIAKVERVQFQSVAELPASSRGAGGFGSTGR